MKEKRKKWTNERETSKREQVRRNEKEWKSKRETKKSEPVKEKLERMNKWKRNVKELNVKKGTR